MLCALSIAAYGSENGYEITLLDDYTSNADMDLMKSLMSGNNISFDF